MMNFIYHINKPTVILIMIVCVFSVAYFHKKISKKLFLCLVGVSLFGIFYCTLCRKTGVAQEINWIPFSTFEEAKELVELYIGLLMNVLLFFPLGLFLPYCLRKYPIFKTILFGTVLSVCIEVIQYKFGLGKAEVDDVIMNGLGTVIGSTSFILSRYFDRKKGNG